MKLRYSLIVVALPFIILSCSKPKNRNPVLPEKIGSTLFSLKELEKSDFVLKLVDSKSLTSTQKPTKDNIKKRYQPIKTEGIKVTLTSNTNPKLQFLFRDLKIKQNQNELAVKVRVTKNYLTAFKIINRTDKTDTKVTINDIEKSIAFEDNGQFWIPIFKFKIEDYGILEKSRDSSGHQTQTLELKKTDWSIATHIVIDPRPEKRLMIDLGEQTYESIEDIFDLEKINNKVFTRQELQEIFLFDFSMLALYPADSFFLVRASGFELKIKLLATKSSPWLTSEEKINLKTFEACDSKQLAEANINNKILASDCILLDRGSIALTYTTPKLKSTTDNLDQNPELEFVQSPLSIDSNFVKIEKNQIIKPQALPQDFNGLIAMKAITNKEFLFRRTVEDASNGLIVATGDSGVTEIVRFAFTTDTVSIRRVDSLFSSTFTKEIDTEELMTFPAKYFQFSKLDDKGHILAHSKLVTTTKQNAEFVRLEISQNKIPISSSPLMYLEGGACFSSVNNVNVDENSIENNLGEGVLNFSYAYSVSLVPNCMNTYPTVSEYWQRALQSTHNIKERISIVSYIPHKVDNYQMPFYAQRKLKFGAFTIANRKYDQFGNYGTDGTEVAHPMMHDIQDGKKIIFYLGGLSSENPRRAQIIQATREVIGNWNETLKKALTGSTQERKNDIIELKIDGVDSEPGHLGDLNKNYIWIVEKQVENQTIGLAQPAANPRNGYIEATNVIIYNGPLTSQVGRFYEAQANFKKHDEFIMKLVENTKSKIKANNEDLVAEEDIASDNDLRYDDPNENSTALIGKDQNIGSTNTRASTRTSTRASTNAKANANANSNSDGNLLYEIYKRTTAENAWKDNAQIKIIANEVFLNQNLKTFSPEQKQQLLTRITKMKLRNQLRQNTLASRPGCAIDFSDDTISQSIYTNVDELYLNTFKHVLSHEVGHSLGLTHNFIASTDKNNFDGRAYSSVMDYSDTSQFEHKGAGTYDLYALRAIYTHRLESNDGGLIDFDEILKNSNSKSWTDFMRLSDQDVTNLNLKPYRYCTDIDLKSDIKCNAWDSGTTATEITINNIKEHMQLYRSANGTNGKLNFSWADTGNYLAQVMSRLQPLRQVLEGYFIETLVNGPHSTEAQDYNNASKQAYMYLLSIIGTPSTDEPYDSPKRFSVVMKNLTPEEFKIADPRYTEIFKVMNNNSNGQPTISDSYVSLSIVEEKSNLDQFISNTDDRLNTRGFAYDKTLAFLILGNRDNLNSRFKKDSALPFSFIEFEKINGFKDSLILNALTDALSGKNSPAGFNFRDGINKLPDRRYQTSSGGMITEIAQQIAIFGLAPSNTNSPDEVNNYLFRIGNHEGSHPTGVLSVNKLEESKNSSSGYHYYQTEGATISNKLIEELFIKREFLEAPEEIVQLIAKGSALIIDIILDLTSRGISFDEILGDGLVAAIKKDPGNQKLKTALTFFDSKSEKIQKFFKQSHYIVNKENEPRQLFELMSSFVANIKLRVLELVVRQSWIQVKIDKLNNLKNMSQDQSQQIEDMQFQILDIGDQINQALNEQINEESKVIPFILAHKAINLLESKALNLAHLVNLAEASEFQNEVQAAGLNVWTKDYIEKNPRAHPDQIEQARTKIDKSQFYKLGEINLGKKQIAELQASREQVKTLAISNFNKLTESFANNTLSFRQQWNQQFRTIQKLSSMFQSYTLEAQK